MNAYILQYLTFDIDLHHYISTHTSITLKIKMMSTSSKFIDFIVLTFSTRSPVMTREGLYWNYKTKGRRNGWTYTVTSEVP